MKFKKSIVTMLIATMTIETFCMSASAQTLTETELPVVETETSSGESVEETTDIEGLLTTTLYETETETERVTETDNADKTDKAAAKVMLSSAKIYAGVIGAVDQKQLSLIFAAFSDKEIYEYTILDEVGETLKASTLTVKMLDADSQLSEKFGVKKAGYVTIPVDKEWPQTFKLVLTSTDDDPKYVTVTIDTALLVQQVKAQQTAEGGTEVSWQQVDGYEGYIVELIQSSDGEMIDYRDVKNAGSCTFDSMAENTSVRIIPYNKDSEDVYYYGTATDTVVMPMEELPQTVVLSAPAATVKNEECKYTLSWNAVENADGYEVSDSTKTKLADMTTTIYEVKGIAGGKTYDHYVRAFKNTEEGVVYSEYSAVITATPTMKTLSKVTGLTAAGGEHKIELKWKAVSGATGYNIYQYNAITKKKTLIATASGTSYRVKNLKAGAYQIVVSAIRKVNDYTNETAVTSAVKATVTTVVPGKVSSLKQKASECMVKLTWKAVSKASGYEIQVLDAKTNKWKTVGKTTSTSYSHKGIVGGTYKYRVRAYRSANSYTEYGTASATVTAKPTMKSLKTPTNYKAAAEEHAVKLTWTKSANATGYAIFAYDTKTKKLTQVGTTTGTTYYVEKLEKGRSYAYVVKAYRKVNGYTHYTGATSVKSAKPTGYTPANVIALRATAAEHAVKLTWPTAKYATNYRIYRYDTETHKKTYCATVSTNSYTTSATLTKDVSYSYLIVPLRKVHQYETVADESNIVAATPYEVTPSAVSGLKVTKGDQQLTLSWTAGKNATSYEIYQVITTDVEDIAAEAAATKTEYKKIKTATGTSITLTGLTNKTDYTYVVKSVRKAGSFVTYSAYSAAATGTPVIGKPKTPKSLTITNSSSDNTLKWTANGLADGYYIYQYNYKKGKYEYVGKTTKTTYVDKDAGSSGKFKYAVKAYRTEDNKIFYVSDGDGVSKMIFGASDVKAASKVHPIYYSATVTRKTGLYGSFRKDNTKKGTISPGAKVTIIYRRWKQSKVSYKGKSYYIYNGAMYVSGQSYTSSDYSDSTKLAFINTGSYKSSSKYLIWISTYTQHINIFKGSKNNWELIKSGKISSGKLSTYTPLGDFDIDRKKKNHYYGRSHYNYLTYFRGDNKMHTRPAYNSGGYHDARLGLPLSNGCVRLTDSMAKWVYQTCPKGTTVLVY